MALCLTNIKNVFSKTKRNKNSFLTNIDLPLRKKAFQDKIKAFELNVVLIHNKNKQNTDKRTSNYLSLVKYT